MAHVFVIGAAVGTIVGAPPRPPQRFPLRNIFTPLPPLPGPALEARARPRDRHGCARDVPPTSRARRYVYRLHRTRPLASPRYPLAPVFDPLSPFPPSLRSQSQQKANAKRPGDDSYHDAETPGNSPSVG